MSAKFAVLVKDGQGAVLDCGAPKKAIALAAAQLRCKKTDIQIINAWNLGGPCYLFNSADADAEYWLSALKLEGEPSFVGTPAQ